MTEDEQLEAAMRASLEESGGDARNGAPIFCKEKDDGDNEGVFIVDPNKQKVRDDSKPKGIEKQIETAPNKPPTPNSILDELKSFDIGAEPEKGARIQFRMPDGKRKIRTFNPSESVKLVYAFVAVSERQSGCVVDFYVSHLLINYASFISYIFTILIMVLTNISFSNIVFFF